MEFDEIRCIGRGNYGTAHLVKDVCTGSLLVVKKIALALLSPKERDDSMREVQVLSRLKHPNIVEYVGSFEREEMLHIVMGYCEGGDLAAQHKAVRSRGQQHSEQVRPPAGSRPPHAPPTPAVPATLPHLAAH